MRRKRRKRQNMVDEATKKTLCAIPLLKTRAGPRDKDLWVTRLKEEYQALIKYVENNKVGFVIIIMRRMFNYSSVTDLDVFFI